MVTKLGIELTADNDRALRSVLTLNQALQGVGKTPATAPKGLSKTNSKLSKISKNANSAKGKLKKLNKVSFSKLRSNLTGVNSKLNTMAKYGVFALGAGLAAGSIAGGAAIVKLGVQMEQTRVRFQTMLGNAEKGDQVLAQLNKFANVTPFTNDEVIGAGKTLLAYGLEAEKLQGTLKIVGDVAAGSGKDFTELSGIIGKVMSKGKADTESLNQMAEAGIPIVKTLSQAYGVSAAEIYKMAEKGKLTSDVINASFQQMTSEGGIFSNMMEKQSQTAGGMWSTVIGKMQFFGSLLGEKLTPIIKTGLGYVVQMADRLVSMTNDGSLIDWLKNAGVIGVSAFAGILKGINYLYEGGKTIFQLLAENAQANFYLIAGGAKLAISGIVGTFYDMINGILSAYNWVMGKFGKDGVELVKQPDWIDDMNATGKNDLATGVGLKKRVFGGDVIKDGLARASEKNAAIDKGVNKIISILSSTEKNKNKEQKKKPPVKIEFPAMAVAAEVAEKAKKIKSPSTKIARSAKNTSVDRLTKIGGYNYGPQIKSIDVQRNGLLKQIVEKLDITPEYRLA